MKFYWKLFKSTFLLSAFTFGGGFVIVPLMRKQFVEQYRWIEEKEMLDLTAIAQSSPGAIAVNAAVLVGYKLAGIPGALITLFGTVLPPLLILSIISIVYASFRDNHVVQAVLRGMQAGVAAVIMDVVYVLIRDLVKEKKTISILLFLLSFVSVFIFHINAIYIILFSGIMGYLLLADRKGDGVEK